MEQISNYLVDFAKKRNLKYRQDEKLNVIIWKDASTGYEKTEPVILQGHMDMVAVKTADCSKNMEMEGLDLEVNGDMLSAKGTSLGGDDALHHRGDRPHVVRHHDDGHAAVQLLENAV